jgi:hypothetical protein
MRHARRHPLPIQTGQLSSLRQRSREPKRAIPNEGSLYLFLTRTQVSAVSLDVSLPKWKVPGGQILIGKKKEEEENRCPISRVLCAKRQGSHDIPIWN